MMCDTRTGRTATGGGGGGKGLLPLPRLFHTASRAPRDPVLPATPIPADRSGGGGSSVSSKWAILRGIDLGCRMVAPLMLLGARLALCAVVGGGAGGGAGTARNREMSCNCGRAWIYSSGSTSRPLTASVCRRNDASVVQPRRDRLAQRELSSESANILPSAIGFASKDTAPRRGGLNSAKKKGRDFRGLGELFWDLQCPAISAAEFQSAASWRRVRRVCWRRPSEKLPACLPAWLEPVRPTAGCTHPRWPS